MFAFMSETLSKIPPSRRLLIYVITVSFILPFLGAVIFTNLELDNEKSTRQDNQDFLSQLQALASPNSTFDQFGGVSREELVQQLEQYSRSEFGIEPVNNDKWLWGYTGSYFFCVQVVTTIGYGKQAPKTSYGRLACVLYGFFGVCLTAVAVQEIGKRTVRNFALLFLSVWERLTRKVETRKTIQLYRRDEEFQRGVDLNVSLSLALFWMLVPSLVIGAVEGWTWPEAIYFAFVSLSTIGFGDFMPDPNRHIGFDIFGLLWLYFGLCIFARLFLILGATMTSFNVFRQPDKVPEDERKHHMAPIEFRLKSRPVAVGLTSQSIELVKSQSKLNIQAGVQNTSSTPKNPSSSSTNPNNSNGDQPPPQLAHSLSFSRIMLLDDAQKPTQHANLVRLGQVDE